MRRNKRKQSKNGGFDEALQGAASLVEQVRTEYKPPDYSEWNVKELIALLCLDQLWGIQCVLKMVCPDRPPSDEVCEKARFIADRPTAEHLVALALPHPNIKPLVFLLQTKLHKQHIGRELHGRLKQMKTGYEMLRLEAGASESTKDLDKLIVRAMAQIKMRTLQKRQGREDLMQTARKVAFERKRELSQTARVKLPEKVSVPPCPPTLGLPQDNPPGWDDYFSDLLARTYERSLRGLMPAAEGAMEEVYTEVTQAFGNLEDYWKVQKRTGKEVILEETEKEVGSNSFKDWLQKEQLEDDGHPESPDISAKMFQVLMEAKKRWGNKVVKALLLMQQGMGEKEAAELAKIPYQSLRRYISKLNKEFSKKS